MTDTDDDPEYEAQLKDVLGDTQRQPGDDGLAREMLEAGDGDAGGSGTDKESEDGVLDNAPSFRIKKKDDGTGRTCHSFAMIDFKLVVVSWE